MNKGNTVLIAIIVVLAIGGTLFVVSRSQKVPDSDVIMEDAMMEEELHGHDGTEPENHHDKVMEEQMEEGEIMEGPFDAVQDGSLEPEPLGFGGQVLAGESSPLLDFNQADYDKALKSDKIVVLYFYANWCPTCKIEVKNGLYPAFNELNDESVIGFRVNYNDNQTDSSEKGLAKEFGVAYQHTKVFVKNGERILKSPESWSREKYLSEINKAI
jgi:thiol-disulfide isomerase/thioredoxin